MRLESAAIGSPAPEIGNIVYVASDVDENGFSTDPEFGPMAMWRRVMIALILAWVVFAAGWLGAMFATNSSPTAAAFAGVAALGLGGLAWRAMGSTKRWGRCVYVGTEGVTKVEVDGPRHTTTTALYRDDHTTTTDATRVFINGNYEYTAESITFWQPDGRPAMHLLATYDAQPTEHAFAVRAAIAASGAKRARWAAWRIARGEAVAFPLLRGEGKPIATGEALVVDAYTLAYYKSPTNWPLRIDRKHAFFALREGYLDLTTRDSGAVLGSFERSKVSNYDVLQQLVA